jgi:hypothetical protein
MSFTTFLAVLQLTVVTTQISGGAAVLPCVLLQRAPWVGMATLQQSRARTVRRDTGEQQQQQQQLQRMQLAATNRLTEQQQQQEQQACSSSGQLLVRPAMYVGGSSRSSFLAARGLMAKQGKTAAVSVLHLPSC